MEPLNNSFPCFYFGEKYDTMDVDLEEKNNLSAFNLNFLKIYENLEGVHVNGNIHKDNFTSIGENFNNLNNTCKDFNFSPPKKKNSIDISYSMEQTFYENSHMNIEEEFQQNEETCKNIIFLIFNFF
jgi:hypothetical protein